MYVTYPNLELLEYKARQYASNDEEVKAEVEVIKNKRKALGKDIRNICFEFEAVVFLQTWGSTALGLSEIGGQAITEAYTTVMMERLTETYYVFFGGRLAYRIMHPKEEFYTDLKNRELKSVKEAMVKY